MAFDAFIKIDGVEGECDDSQYRDWIEILGYGIGLQQTISWLRSSAGGATAGRINFRDFVFKKEMDISSPQLALICANGTHIDNVTVDICRAGTKKIRFLQYRMSNCLICQVSTGGGAGYPTETVRINFGEIHWAYNLQNRKGGASIGQEFTA
jgi:type VI secretion system secreted protein Hcp